MAIDPRLKTLSFSNGVTTDYSGLVSSIALPDLLPMINGAPRDVVDASQRLACSTCVLVNVGVDRADLSQSQMTYFYDEDIIFTRLSFPHMLSPTNVPPGCGSIQAEVYFSSKYRPLTQAPEDSDRARDHGPAPHRNHSRGRQDLTSHARVVRHANVIFDLDRTAALRWSTGTWTISGSPIAVVTATGGTCGRMRASSAGNVQHSRRCRSAESRKFELVTHRASYWKSTALSLAAACVSLFLIVWVRLLDLPPALVMLVSLLGAVALAVFLVVAAGGLVCLWRDALESSGKDDPLLHYALWEPETGLLASAGLASCRVRAFGLETSFRYGPSTKSIRRWTTGEQAPAYRSCRRWKPYAAECSGSIDASIT